MWRQLCEIFIKQWRKKDDWGDLFQQILSFGLLFSAHRLGRHVYGQNSMSNITSSALFVFPQLPFSHGILKSHSHPLVSWNLQCFLAGSSTFFFLRQLQLSIMDSPTLQSFNIGLSLTEDFVGRFLKHRNEMKHLSELCVLSLPRFISFLQ